MTPRLSRHALLLLAPLLALLLVTAAQARDEGELLLPPGLLAELDARADSLERLFEVHEARLQADRPAFLAWLRDAAPDTVPADVKCEKVKRCDLKNVCAIVCKRGSVEVGAWLRRALELQRRLAFRRNFCRAQLPGTHNSAINLADVRRLATHHLLLVLTVSARERRGTASRTTCSKDTLSTSPGSSMACTCTRTTSCSR